MWKDLSIQQKSEVMKMAISQGLTDLNEIKKMYDASIPNIEASSVNNTYSSVPYNPSPKDVRYAYGGPLGNIYKGTGNKSQKLNIWTSGAWTADDLASELLRLGVRARVTSKGRSAKQQARFNTPANRSWHVKNKAIDVVPTTNWDDLKADLLKPEVRALFNSAGIGVLNERPASVQKKTGATGAHFHIGPDRSARAGYAAWTNSKMPNGPQINIESPVFHTAANDLQWQPPIVASSRQEDIAPLLVQNNKPLIVEPLEDTSSTPKDFSAIWDQIFPKIENTQEQFNPLLDPSTQFTALQSRPRYQMKPTPIINMPVSNGDNDYMLFKPLAKGGNLFDNGGKTFPIITTSGSGYVPASNLVGAVEQAAFDYATGNGQIPVNEIRRRLYEGLVPVGYANPISRVHSAVVENNYIPEENRDYFVDKYRDDIWAEYLQIPKENRHKTISFGKKFVSNSDYAPSVGKDSKVQYKRINLDKNDKEALIRDTNNLTLGESTMSDGTKTETTRYLSSGNLGNVFGRYTMSRGLDPDKGEYRSYYDLWDLTPNGTSYTKGDQSKGIGTPIHFYDRVYLNDYYDIPAEELLPDKGDFYGGWKPEIIVTPQGNYINATIQAFGGKLKKK